MSPSHFFSPVKIAVALAVLFAFWLLIGDKKSAQDAPPAAQQAMAQGLPKVEVITSYATDWQNAIVAQGQIEPWQTVAVTAQVEGRIEQLLADQGQPVIQGQPLLKLSDEGRQQRLVQAQAQVRLANQELASATTLKTSRLVADTELSRLRSAAELAKAQVEAAQLAVDYGEPKAPFTGVVNRRYVDVGAYVKVGDALMDVVVIDKLKVVAQIPQQQVAQLQNGQHVEVRLLDGREFTGIIMFISYAADPTTRTYAIEVSANNPTGSRVAGASATLRIHLPTARVHRVSPALLSLNKAGQLGVHAVAANNTVQFYPVTVVNLDNEGASVLGLPESFRLITTGAGFVAEGQTVEPVEAKP